jgi:hypothetical protein
MGYRIDFAVVGGGTVRATVSGKSSLRYAAHIARDIAEQAASRAAKRLLIDVRALADRVGTLGTLLVAACAPVRDCRVALLDSADHERYAVFSELAARRRGYDVRAFDNPSEALSWLAARER